MCPEGIRSEIHPEGRRQGGEDSLAGQSVEMKC